VIVNLTDKSEESLQAQLVRQIRTLILYGDLEAGRQLPSIRQLAGEQRVSVVTVQRAYEALEGLGLIHVRRGKGYFVSELSHEDRMTFSRTQLLARLVPIFRQARAEGLEASGLQEAVRIALEVSGRD